MIWVRFPSWTETFLYALGHTSCGPKPVCTPTLGSVPEIKCGRGVQLTIKLQLVHGSVKMGGILSVLLLVFIGKVQGQIHGYLYFYYWLIRRVDRDTRNVPQSGLIAVQLRTAFEHRPQHSF